MFNDIERNKIMIRGSYLRLKSYYHYNKNYIFMKEKIASFEEDENAMEETFDLLSRLLQNPDQYASIIDEWLGRISYYILPKAIKKETSDGIIVTDDEKENTIVNKVNFFIKMPFELYLLDTLWCLLLGKIVSDSNALEYGCYGNCIEKYVTYNKEKDFYKSINFDKSRLFCIYFPKYCEWKNAAINAAEEFTESHDMALVTLDIKSYYYSVRWKFDDLRNFFPEDKRLGQIENLTGIIEKVFCRYTHVLNEVRVFSPQLMAGESILPIGMFSSMLLANLYLSHYDKTVLNNKGVLHYGRYVDDILLLIDTKGKKMTGKEGEYDELLVFDNGILDHQSDTGYYSLKGYPSLFIQKEKVKIIFFEKKKSYKLLKTLAATKIEPSQMDPLPEIDLKLEDFEDAAYALRSLGQETKIRDINLIDVDRFRLGLHMHKIVTASKHYFSSLIDKEKPELFEEKKKILSFFKKRNAIDYCSNWINVFYFFLLSETNTLSGWEELKENLKDAIEGVELSIEEYELKEKEEILCTNMKEGLRTMVEICMATALALNPMFSGKEQEHVNKLALLIRHANLFNHKLVSFPLINYYSSIPDNLDLTRVSIVDLINYRERLRESKKIKYSPRFIRYGELFYHDYCYNLGRRRTMFVNGNNEIVDNGKMDKNLLDFFFEVNRIRKIDDSEPDFSITSEEKGGYIIQRVNLGNKDRYRTINNRTYCLKPGEKIKVAVANFEINDEDCLVGLPGARTKVSVKKSVFRNSLNKAFREKVDYILLPEFYMPYEWIPEALEFVEKTGISIITGLKYATVQQTAYNQVAFLGAFYSGQKKQYRGACFLAREKNDYAPMEKVEVIKNKAICHDQITPVYQIIEQNGVRFGIFLCYEFTDIKARALYKNEVDIIFTPEYNKDTTYFGSIIESLTRDLHVFIVQSNTSHFGDSRITGPYSRDDRNIVLMKGGDTDELIIGTLDIFNMHEFEKSEEEKMKKLNNGIIDENDGLKNQNYNKKFKEFKRMSARFYLRNEDK